MKFNNYILLVILAFMLVVTGCRKFIEVDQPPNSITSEFVFSSDANATSAMLGLYSGFVLTANTIGAQGPLGTLSDDLRHFDAANPWFVNNVSASDATALSQWTGAYKFVYNVNEMIRGVNESATITADTKRLLDGEAKFLRAYFYFYLTNMYGKVPLLLTPDYKVNAVAPRAEITAVYAQIIADLKDAQNQLKDDYLDARNLAVTAQERVRANRATATALLSRVYLYQKDYVQAEVEATKVITDKSRYDLVPVANVFLKNSKETILQIVPGNIINLPYSSVFVLTGVPNTSRPFSLQNGIVNSFEAGDRRRSSWVNSITVSGNTYYFPYKYKTPTGTAVTTPIEYDMVLRVAEQYLIRAEARINQGGTKVADGIADLNIIRDRAREAVTVAVPNPLPALSGNLSQAIAIQAVEDERRHELFTEMGHRWFDLIRTGRADVVLGALKGSNWQPTDKLLPVPFTEIEKNSNLRPQNLGY